MLLQPLEEMTFSCYSRAAAERSSVLAQTADKCTRSIEELVHLHVLLRATSIFGLLFLAFGPAYSWLLLRMLYGEAWTHTDAPHLLPVYCAHVCAMSLNGVSEAYVSATASPRTLRRVAVAATGITLLFAIAAMVGVRLAGTYGLVLANVLNLTLRTVVSYGVIRSETQPVQPVRPLRLSPSLVVLSSMALAAIVTNVTGRWLAGPRAPLVGHAVHVVVGLCSLAGVACAVAASELELVQAGRALWDSSAMRRQLSTNAPKERFD